MAIPLSYSVRNLIERRGTTLMTAAGIAMAVGVLAISVSLSTGITRTFALTGDPAHLIVLRDGTDSELSSGVTAQAFGEIRLMPGIAKTPEGEPMASGELVSVINLPSVDSPDGMNVTIRGLGPVGIGMRNLRITDGRWFTPGRREVTVGESIAKRYADARIGGKLHLGRGDWEVVGIFSGSGSAAASEIWCDLNQLRADFDRQGDTSSVLLRATSVDEAKRLKAAISDSQRYGADAVFERDYYESMTSSGAGLKYVGGFVAIIMAIGSGFGAMNTMYAAVSRRTREIGTLRALGFTRLSILTSFVIESVLLALVGGGIGVLLAMPLNLVTTGVGNDKTFSEIAFNFRVGTNAIVAGFVFAAVIGAIGGLLPAQAAARKNPLAAMREG
jgi:putative ABC transport system permease protein